MGIVRSSFLIDEQGVIEKASFKVKPIPTQRSCWVSKKCVSVVISGDERTSPDMHQDTLHAGKRGCGKCRSLRLHWGSLVMALSILLEENIFTIVPAFLGSMLVNPGDHRDQRARLTFCFLQFLPHVCFMIGLPSLSRRGVIPLSHMPFDTR